MWKSRLAALAEVTVAFAVMHAGFRLIMKKTAFGRADMAAGTNFSPGLTMIAVSLAIILLKRRRLAEYGLSLRDFFANVKNGFGYLTCAAVVAAVVAALGYRHNVGEFGPVYVLVSAVGGIVALTLFLWIARLLSNLPLPQESSAILQVGFQLLSLLLLLGIPAFPLVAAFWQSRPLGAPTLMILWILIGSGLGEEAFFRGYVQSRFNEVFGRPWEFLGVSFGAGLFLTCGFFALVHLLNPTDYFVGHYQFAWWHAFGTFFSFPLGFLREKTGSVVAPAVAHGYMNLIARLLA